ncbi:Restriction endonuclease [Flavobacterium longum]|uniref:McrC family protein n=1 Tax=Flavobacterium longum TaxID=1299340 RepID=UPI0039EAFE60
MSKKNFIQVFEHHKLKYDESSDFKKSHFDALVQFNEKNHNRYYTIIHKGILFNSYVGVIQIGGLTIEILPKADNHSIPDKSKWQSVLLNMLKVCKHIDIDKVSEANLKKRQNSILDIYFEMFLDEVEGLINKGLIKKYRRVQSNQLALKGKLVFSKNLKNIIHKERFFCEHQVYDKDHLVHQIIFKALMLMKELVGMELTDRLNRVIFEFQDFKEVSITQTHFTKIDFNRKVLPYQKAVEISKMIILNYSPNLNSGNQNMLTLLFDMNQLWEEYVFRILNKHKPEGHSVSYQNSEKFWEYKKIRPDIVYRGTETIVIDTKWKIVENNKPSDDDLKQMFTYNLHWEAEKSILLYPKINQTDSHFGRFWYNDLGKKCKLAYISLFEDAVLKPNNVIAKEIRDKFEFNTILIGEKVNLN